MEFSGFRLSGELAVSISCKQKIERVAGGPEEVS